MSDKPVHLTVTMQVTVPQALALQAMFAYWNQLSSWGSSREVGFFCDGDGDFKPKCVVKLESVLPVPALTDELSKAAISGDNDGDQTYDYDAIAWKLRG